ncbi:tRNA pseudouridine synthase A [invertebrate metagenome]|uniref:tRNA pseudouridine synthase A n=1 Tax=invertebrate metagenome TaxID=1711999 RepID=A0A2H9T9C0_9ZZZZ
MPRYAAGVQYDGSGFYGWQRLKSGLPTVQEAIENALSVVANHDIAVVCAGRTDTGVHGCRQVIHFDTHAIRTDRSWVLGTNRNLPDSVAIDWVKRVPDDFHARFSAQWRRYRYVIYNGSVRPAHLPYGVTWCHRPLNTLQMQEAANYLSGEHDFTSYRAVQCQAKSPVRTIHDIHVMRTGNLVVIDVRANAFLHHMVRNIAGVLMAIGTGKQPVFWAKEVLQARDRRKGGVTAKSNGLYFVDVGYPESFDLPGREIGPFFLAGLFS